MQSVQRSWQQKFIALFFPLLIIILSLHAAYIAMIGGSGFFFMNTLALLILWWFNIRTHKWLQIISMIMFSLVVITIAFGVIATNILSLIIVSIYFIIIFIKKKSWTWKTAIFSLLIFVSGLNQHQYLTALQLYYSQYQIDDSWQKSAAL